MTGQLDEPDQEYTQDQIRDGFCNLLDSHADEYNAHIIGEFNFTFLGLGIGGLLLVAFVTCCTACCCCKCCNKVKEKIRRLDPRNAMREARIGAMQGQSLGMPGGAPAGYPEGPGYPPQQP